MAISETDRPEDGVLNRVSTEIVRLYKDQMGRGPTKVRSHFAGPDTLVCLLEDSLTPAERTLASMGEHQRLRDVRLFFQHATSQQFRDAVELVPGRTVRAFISGMDTEVDVSAEIFVLEPADGNQNGARV